MQQRISEFYDAVRAQDVDRIAACFRPDAKHRIYSASTTGQAEFAGEYEGVEAIRGRFAAVREVWTVTDVAIVELVIDGTKAAAKIQASAVAASGRRTLNINTMHFLTFDGDLLAEFDVFINEMQMSHSDPAMATPSS